MKRIHLAVTIWLAAVWHVGGGALDHWTLRPIDNASASRVAYGAGTFVALGERGTNVLMSSDDGITWTTRQDTPDPLLTVTFGDGIFVGVGASGITARSTNGVNWSISRVSATGFKDLFAITHGEGLFVAAGVLYLPAGGRRAIVYVSPDGLAWSEWISNTNAALRDVAYGAGRYVAVNAAYATAGDPNRALWVSTNGVDWAPRNPGGFGDVTGITYGYGQFVAMADTGETATALTSPDGDNWVAHPLSVSGHPRVDAMHFANGTYMALGSFNNSRYLMLLSTNGVSWQTNHIALLGNASHLLDAAFGQGTFIITVNGAPLAQSASVIPAWFDKIERAGSTRLDISGEVGRAYHLQFSTNLADWHYLFTYTNSLPTVRVIDSTPGPRRRIYRAVTD